MLSRPVAHAPRVRPDRPCPTRHSPTPHASAEPVTEIDLPSTLGSRWPVGRRRPTIRPLWNPVPGPLSPPQPSMRPIGPPGSLDRSTSPEGTRRLGTHSDPNIQPDPEHFDEAVQQAGRDAPDLEVAGALCVGRRVGTGGSFLLRVRSGAVAVGGRVLSGRRDVRDSVSGYGGTGTMAVCRTGQNPGPTRLLTSTAPRFSSKPHDSRLWDTRCDRRWTERSSYGIGVHLPPGAGGCVGKAGSLTTIWSRVLRTGSGGGAGRVSGPPTIIGGHEVHPIWPNGASLPGGCCRGESERDTFADPCLWLGTRRLVNGRRSGGGVDRLVKRLSDPTSGDQDQCST